ncbi:MULTISPECIES: NAD(P)-binding domain-containing protein [unclassified Staphylococcus]|uniref:NADPH-dependent F420 reductase n=1 Tax=unclassified Staphylococcus TaxID=91994 RepID=UPI0021D3E3D8|nr:MULTISPECIES: NAD(P)-binding domain-containing protein [unclassified Staphylococcus]UXR72587.1 NAD(P)-binding domain-containing protein [Staphylococcus sp. IVB6240]UXR74892.1 NAD(P)-binding domain-containing protein [Staphylococcus sp. IVB6238]UXR77225.1 NAD(P)-binding domain-containing protein [Staphylococcus sp. IVB6233]
MKFGIIGAGPIGATLSHKLHDAGHAVKVADVRSTDFLKDKDISGQAVPVEEVVKDIDVLILSLPLFVIENLKPIIDKVEKHVIVVDTSNYYPFRDPQVKEIEEGMPESVWVSKQIGRDVVKAFNNQLAYTLAERGKAENEPGRIGMAVSGNDAEQKATVMGIINEVGFDPVDNGSLENSWRHHPGTPAYCTELSENDLRDALERADKEAAPKQRDEVGKHFKPGMTHDDVVQLNRKLYKA